MCVLPVVHHLPIFLKKEVEKEQAKQLETIYAEKGKKRESERFGMSLFS